MEEKAVYAALLNSFQGEANDPFLVIADSTVRYEISPLLREKLKEDNPDLSDETINAFISANQTRRRLSPISGVKARVAYINRRPGHPWDD